MIQYRGAIQEGVKYDTEVHTQVTGYEVISFTVRMDINGGADLGEMSFVWNMWNLGYLWKIQVELSLGNLSYGLKSREILMGA